MNLCDFTNEPEMKLDTADLVINKQTTFFGNPVRFGVLGATPNTQIWFVANDVCKCLGLNNPRVQISRLRKRHPEWIFKTHVIDQNGQSQETNVIAEDLVTILIVRSNKAEAVPFQKWVGKVIRTIRNRGVYKLEKDMQLTIKMQQLALEEAKAKEAKAAAAQNNWLTINRQRAVMRELGIDKKGLPQINGFDPDLPHAGFVEMVKAQRDAIHKIKMQKKRGKIQVQTPLFVPDLTHPNFANLKKTPWKKPQWINIKPTGHFRGSTRAARIINNSLANIDTMFVQPM